MTCGYIKEQEVVLEKIYPGYRKILESRLCGYLKEQEVVLEKNISRIQKKTQKVGDMDISRNEGYFRKKKYNQDTKKKLK